MPPPGAIVSVAAPPVREHRPAVPAPVRAPAVPAPVPPTPGSLASASARVAPSAPTPLPPGAPDHELNLVGGSPLVASGEVVDYVKGRGGVGAPVRVRVGTIAAGQITVVARGSQLRTTKTQGIPLLLPLFSPLRGAGLDPVLALDVDEKGVEGYASVRTGAKIPGKSGLPAELRKHADLIGWAGLDQLNLPELTNELQGATLVLRCRGLTFSVSGFLHATGSLEMTNEVVTFSATATGRVPGLASITVPIERAADGSLAGKVTVDLTVRGFSGQVEASYAHGVVDVIGTVRYTNEKFDGSVTLAATDTENAKALTAAHTPAEVKTVAPAREGATPHEAAAPAKPAAAPAAAGTGPAPGAAVTAKKGDRVLVGWGTVNVRLAEWLSGEAVVVVNTKGAVTVVGKITPRMTKPLFDPRDYAYSLPKLEVHATYGVPVVGNIFVFANVGLEALARLGPATLTDMEMVGTWSTDPAVLQNFALTGTLNISAFAGLRVRAEGGAGLEILEHEIKVGVGLGALAGIRGYVDARPRIGYREVADPAAGKKGEFYIGGHLDIAAQPFLQLTGDFFVDLDSPWWSPAPDKRWTWPLGSLEYPLPGEFGIGADIEHVLGSGKMPEIQFGKVDFDASRFMTDLVDDHVPPKKSVDEQKKGSWKESQPAAAAAPVAAAPPPGKALPTGPAGGPPKLAGAGAKPRAAAVPTVGGASGKTAKDAAQTPKPENDAKVKKAVDAYGKLMKKAKAHPESEAEIEAILVSLKSVGFQTAEAKRVGDHWHVKATINNTMESNLDALPSSASGPSSKQPAAAPPVTKPAQLTAVIPKTKIRLLKGDNVGKTATVVAITSATLTVGGKQETHWVVKYKIKLKPGSNLALVGNDLTFEVVAKAQYRAAKILARDSDDTGKSVSAEVGIKIPPHAVAVELQGWSWLSLNARKTHWVAAHLLNGALDGPGVAWNLALAPKATNNSMRSTYEDHLRGAAHDEDREFYFRATVTNHANDSSSEQLALRAVQPAFDARRFAQRIDVVYKEIEDGKPGPEKKHPFTNIRLPIPSELAGYEEPRLKAVQPIRRPG